MLDKVMSVVHLLGGKTEILLVGGGVSLLLGFVGLALLLTTNGASLPRRRRFRHVAMILASMLLVLLGGAALLGVALVIPLQRDIKTLSRDLNNIALLQSHELALAIMSRPRYGDPKKLSRYEFRMFSQNGEDGIIAEIFRRIGTTNRSFVEFGSSDGSENNTVFLLRLGWNGWWIDGDTAAVSRARKAFHSEISDKRLTVTEAFVTAENIEALFRRGKVPEEFDLLSIDIDRNDYHVWNRILNYRPRCVVIEYNASFPPGIHWVVPYDPKAWGWNEFGNGASLKAVAELGAKKGYSLVACDLGGVNAFFVRNDLLGDHFAAPYTADNHYEPFRHPLLRSHLYEKSTLGP